MDKNAAKKGFCLRAPAKLTHTHTHFHISSTSFRPSRDNWGMKKWYRDWQIRRHRERERRQVRRGNVGDEKYPVRKDYGRKKQEEEEGRRRGKKKDEWRQTLSNKRQSDPDLAPLIHGMIRLTRYSHAHTHIHKERTHSAWLSRLCFFSHTQTSSLRHNRSLIFFGSWHNRVTWNPLRYKHNDTLSHTHTPWCQVALPLVLSDSLCQLMTSKAFITWLTKEPPSKAPTHTHALKCVFHRAYVKKGRNVFQVLKSLLTQISQEIGLIIGDLIENSCFPGSNRCQETLKSAKGK